MKKKMKKRRKKKPSQHTGSQQTPPHQLHSKHVHHRFPSAHPTTPEQCVQWGIEHSLLQTNLSALHLVDHTLLYSYQMTKLGCILQPVQHIPQPDCSILNIFHKKFKIVCGNCFLIPMAYGNLHPWHYK